MATLTAIKQDIENERAAKMREYEASLADERDNEYELIKSMLETPTHLSITDARRDAIETRLWMQLHKFETAPPASDGESQEVLWNELDRAKGEFADAHEAYMDLKLQGLDMASEAALQAQLDRRVAWGNVRDAYLFLLDKGLLNAVVLDEYAPY